MPAMLRPKCYKGRVLITLKGVKRNPESALHGLPLDSLYPKSQLMVEGVH